MQNFELYSLRGVGGNRHHVLVGAGKRSVCWSGSQTLSAMSREIECIDVFSLHPPEGHILLSLDPSFLCSQLPRLASKVV